MADFGLPICPNCGSVEYIRVDLFASRNVQMISPTQGIVREMPVITEAGYCNGCGTLQESYDNG